MALQQTQKEEGRREPNEGLNSLSEDLYQKFPTRILDDVDVREVLKISRRTSLEYRQKGYLRFHRFADDSKIFYLLDEIIEDIRNSSKS
jgi:hypothetical protein